MTPDIHPPPTAEWKQSGNGTTLALTGDWLREGPSPKVVGASPTQFPASYDTKSLGAYDSTLPAFLCACFRGIMASSSDKATTPTLEGLPDNLRGLLQLALAVPEEIETENKVDHGSRLEKLGQSTLKTWSNLLALLDFTGQTVESLARFFRGKARFRSSDFWITLQECGVEALPIVSLISFLIGLILAFVGNVQLTNFGANLFVADLVGIAMVREMGVVMAAHIGSMKANEEIDALRTFGFNPFDFLVLPRLLALVLMMPILTVYANIVGILGGMLVGSFVSIPPVLYWTETLASLDMRTSSLGVFKSVFFGAAIAISGCMQGLQAGKSSAAVGQATTRAVVASITAVVVIDSAFAAIFTILKI